MNGVERISKGIPKITLLNQLFTIKSIDLINQDSKIIFFSDIRSGDSFTMTHVELEQRIKIDMELQKMGVEELCPIYSMLKFRLPWSKEKVLYLKGEIYTQVFVGSTSTESRLYID